VAALATREAGQDGGEVVNRQKILEAFARCLDAGATQHTIARRLTVELNLPRMHRAHIVRELNAAMVEAVNNGGSNVTVLSDACAGWLLDWSSRE
jgi:hypothetical protein